MGKESMKDDEPRPEASRGVEGEPRREAFEAEARVREIVDLAARVRHEINNPLTGLIGQAQLLLRDETLSESARRRVETIEQLAKRIRDTVAELRVVQHAATARADETSAAEGPARRTEKADEPPRH